MLASLRTSARSPLLQVLKTSVAALLSWIVSFLLLGQPAPIFAAIAALLVVQPSVNQSLARGVERSVGVILGVIIAYVVGRFFGDDTWVVLTVIVISLLVAWVLRLTPASSNQIPISAMLVLVIGSQTAGYALDRVLETVIGALVGLAVNAAIVPPVLTAPALLAVTRLSSAVVTSLEALAGALSAPLGRRELDALLGAVRELRPLQRTAADELARAQESLSFNPRGGPHRDELRRIELLLERLRILVNRSIGMTRAVHDNYDQALVHDPVVAAIAQELRRAAHDTTLLTRQLTASDPGTQVREPAVVTADLPALTAPLVVTRPDPVNWVLIGSLLEDLRRIREEIIGAAE